MEYKIIEDGVMMIKCDINNPHFASVYQSMLISNGIDVSEAVDLVLEVRDNSVKYVIIIQNNPKCAMIELATNFDDYNVSDRIAWVTVQLYEETLAKMIQ